MQTINSEYINFNIESVDQVNQLDYIRRRQNSFEYSMDIVYDSNKESSYIITITHKDNKTIVIPFYVRVLPRVIKLFINCNDYAITKTETILDVNANQNIYDYIYYKQKYINLYYVCNYSRYNDKYLISNWFLKNIKEIYPKYGFSKAKKEYCIEKGVTETKSLFNINNIYFSESEFESKRGNSKEIKTFDELKEIDEFKILLMDDKEYSFQ